jgi:hypothetical protein
MSSNSLTTVVTLELLEHDEVVRCEPHSWVVDMAPRGRLVGARPHVVAQIVKAKRRRNLVNLQEKSRALMHMIVSFGRMPLSKVINLVLCSNNRGLRGALVMLIAMAIFCSADPNPPPTPTPIPF